MKGGAGDDIIYGAAGSDTITTGNGANVVVTGNATTVGGGAGGDHVTGGTGIDNVTGGTGADTINSAGGADIISAGAGNDIIDGGTGADVITGGTGADNITGGSGNDTFKYAAGDSAGATKDTITDFAATAAGVAGDKLEISLTLAAGGITFTETDRGDVASTAEAPGNLGGVAGDFVFNDGTSEFMLDVNGDGNINVNDLVIGLTGETAFAEADVAFNITGGAGADIITLGSNDDTIDGAGGADIILAGAGDDTISDSAAADVVTGGAGADSIDASTGTDDIRYASKTDGAAATKVTGQDVLSNFTEGTDTISFDSSVLINGALGNTAITVFEASSAVDLNTADNAGVFVIDTTVTVADGLSALASSLATIAQNETADDAFVFVVDNDTTTYIVHWDDREANGGDGGGDIDAAELTILAQLTEGDAHGAGYQATGDFLLY